MALKVILLLLIFSYTSHGLNGGPLSPNNFPLDKPHQNQDTENKDLTPKIKNQIPKDDCKKLLADFSTCVSNYTECTTVFARPMGLCLRCRDKYLSVMSAYRSMENFKQDNVSCKEVLTNQDRLSIIDHTYQDITDEESIWETASCKNCYMGNDPNNLTANHTLTFQSLYAETMECFGHYFKFDLIRPIIGQSGKSNDNWELQAGKLGDKISNNGSLCMNCSMVYNKLREYFWTKVVPSNEQEKLSGVCYDLRDAFNLTGVIWKDEFNCESKPLTLKTVLPAIFLTCFIIILTYTCEPFILSWIFPSKIEQRVLIAQHDVYEGDPAEVDEDQIIDGRFEVVPGVTADEYIKRFTTVEISNPSDQRNFRIRVPPPPEAFYDTEWNNDEWVLPPKEVFIKMHAVVNRWRNGEISQREMDLLQCKIIVEELEKKRKTKKPRRSSRELIERAHYSSGDSSLNSVNVMTQSTSSDMSI